MKKKLPIAIRGILSSAFLLLFAGLLNTTPGHSAYPFAPAINPTLTLTKTMVNDNGGGAGQTDFQAKIDDVNVDWDTPISLDPGTRTASEVALVTGYSASTWGLDCAADGTITLVADQIAECTITNDDISPELTIIKDVINDYGGTLGPGDFTINVTGTNVSNISFPGAGSPGTTVTLDADTYDVSESPVTGYEPSYSADCTGSIAVGETKTCTITNEDFARLTVEKVPTNINGGTALPDDFLLTVNGSPVLSGVPTEYQINTPLAINETQLIGYTFNRIDGAGCPAVLEETFTLALGDDITCTVVNDDIPAIKPVPSGGLVTDENGTTDQFTVVLTTTPTDSVTIAVSSSVPAEASVDPVELNFTIGNWDTPQPVTVTGVNDDVADGDIPYNIILDPTTSTAAEYAVLTPVQVSGTNFDNDTAGYIITPTEDLQTTEGGVTQKVEISLRSKPTDLVTLSLVSSDLTEGTVSPISLIIDPTTWPQPAKEVTITGVDDIVIDGDVEYSITISSLSTDSNYTGLAGEITLTNHDAPTIRWVKPVGDGEIYFVESLNPIYLEVESVGNEPISKVRFYRWVPSVGDWVTIGEDLTKPYTEILDPLELEFEWNEIRAFAFGPVPTLPGEIQTFSPHPNIYIYRNIGDKFLFLPLLRR